MRTSEVLVIPGDPRIGVGWLGIPEAWLGFAADATGGEDEDDDSEAQGLTLEAEDGEIDYGALFYDSSASSCYAVGSEEEEFYFGIYFDVDSTSLTGDRPLRVRVIYKSTGNAEISVTTFHDGNESSFTLFQVSATIGYTAEEIAIPVSAEPFERIGIGVYRYSSEVYIDAIQLAPATGDWPPLNPCSS